MKQNITQVASKLSIVLAILIISGCSSVYTPPPEKIRSQLEWRQLQSKTFAINDEKIVLKATIAALQDSGYSIRSANENTGLISAMNVTDFDGGCASVPGRMPYCLIAIEELVTGTITKVAKDEIRVRISIKKNGKTDSDATEWTRNVGDENLYKSIFQEISKSIFLQKENL